MPPGAEAWRFRGGGTAAHLPVWPHCVTALPRALNQYLRLGHHTECLDVCQLVPQLAIERPDGTVLPRTAELDGSVLTPDELSQCRVAPRRRRLACAPVGARVAWQCARPTAASRRAAGLISMLGTADVPELWYKYGVP